MHHRTIQIIHQPDATIFQFIILTFVYSSTCFGRFPAHHQELNGCNGSLWVYLRIVVTVVLCQWSGRPAGRPARPLTPHPHLMPWSRKGRLFLSFSDFVFLRLSVFLRLLRLSQTFFLRLSVFLRLFFLLSFSDYSFFYSFCLSQTILSIPPMGRTACTEPRCLYKGAFFIEL